MEVLTRRRARRARRIARAVIAWRRTSSAGVLSAIPTRLLARAEWRDRHLIDPTIRTLTRSLGL